MATLHRWSLHHLRSSASCSKRFICQGMSAFFFSLIVEIWYWRYVRIGSIYYWWLWQWGNICEMNQSNSFWWLIFSVACSRYRLPTLCICAIPCSIHFWLLKLIFMNSTNAEFLAYIQVKYITWFIYNIHSHVILCQVLQPISDSRAAHCSWLSIPQ